MVNRITTIFDFNESGGGLKKIKADVAATDGAIAKTKVGIKGLWAEFAGNRIAQAAVAGMAVKLGKDAVDAASRLEESINAVNVTFGESADEIGRLGEESIDSYGMSERAFNQMAVGFAGFAETVAGSGGDVSQVIDDMATRIADFASVHDLTMDEAIVKFQAALAGEAEAMRRYNIDISAATVKTHAYEKGIAEAGSELTEQQKVMSRYSLIMQETEQWADDFQNTSGSLANQQRKLTGATEKLQATLGKQLLPVATDVTETLLQLAETTEKAVTVIEASGDRVPPQLKKVADAAWALSVPVLLVKGPIDAASWALDKVGLAAEESAFSLETAQKSYWQQKYAAEQLGQANTELAEDTEEAGEAIAETMSDAANIIQSQIDGAITEFDRYGSSIEKWRADNEAAAEAAAEAQEEFRSRVEEAMSGATSAVFSFSDETLADVDAWQQEMLAKTWELGKWQNNLLEIAGRTSADFATYLAGMGEAGMDLVNELANSEDELQESFDIWKGTTEVAGRDMAALFEQIGGNAAAGLALGLKLNWPQVDSALARLTHSTVEGLKGDLDIRSPSEVFAKEIGEPIAEGIAEGIERDGRKIADALRDQIKDAADAAIDAAEDLVDAANDALDGLFDEQDQEDKIEDLNRKIRDALADVAKEESLRGTDKFDPVALSDAQEDVRDAAMDLFEQKLRDPNRIFGRKSNQSLYQVGGLAGLSREEIDEFIAAAVAAQNAQTTLSTTTAAAEGSSAALIAKVDELIGVIGAPGGLALSGGYTINLNGFANEQSIQMLIDAITEIRRREAGAA